MYKIYFRDLAVSYLDSFFKSYALAYQELYQDSGIWSEDLIINQYILSAQGIKDNIFAEISRRLSAGKVLGRRTVGQWQEIDFFLDGRLILIYFSEDAGKKLRIIESITINRKPIIF